MKRIFKYGPLTRISIKPQELNMHSGATILKVGIQRDVTTAGPQEGIYLWALVNDSQEKVVRFFDTFETGEKLGALDLPTHSLLRNYIDTVLLDEGKLVCHIFEVHPYSVENWKGGKP